MVEKNIPQLECVDATVTERILELSRPGLAPDDRRVLEAHLEVCAFCRQTVDLDRRLADAIRGGSSRPTRSGRRRRGSRLSVAAAVLAAAAALACLMILPPRAVGPEINIRGADSARFLRPVEGEVVPESGTSVSWSPVEGADAYEVHLSEVDGDGNWSASTEEPRWEIPADLELEKGRYRLVLATVPTDLLAPGETSVRFRVGTTSQFVSHRMTHAPPIVYGLLALCLVLGLVSLRAKKEA